MKVEVGNNEWWFVKMEVGGSDRGFHTAGVHRRFGVDEGVERRLSLREMSRS